MRITKSLFPTSKFQPGKDNDCLQLCGKEHFVVKDCIIDASNLDPESMDEACGITHGASAEFDHCLFRGASKLVLIGSGDKEFAEAEDGKKVTFRKCWFDNFGRRGPEVQCGMNCVMDGCLITDWGREEKYSDRTFGAWSHKNAVLYVRNSVFLQSVKPSFKLWFKDHAYHISQAWKDHGPLALFKRRTYVSGYKRACTYDHGDLSDVFMQHCYVQDGLVADNNFDPMSEGEAFKRVAEMHNYFEALQSSLQRICRR